MAKRVFYSLAILFLLIIGIGQLFWSGMWWFLIPVGFYILVGLYDLIQTRHNVLRNYPFVGHFRYLFEFIRPEIQQYFVATNQSGRPYSREQRDTVYIRAHNLEDELPFGTQHDIADVGYESLLHSMAPQTIEADDSRVMIGGPACTQPYAASRLNVSAMSFGAISKNAVMALNKGAKLANCYQNTGEGGLSKYHLWGGGDIVMQLGTGYFGCRNDKGGFDETLFTEKANLDAVKMIEIKISQGAKPATGGTLLAPKISAEIAETRGVPVGKDCISPNKHPEFSTPLELLDFVKRLRAMANGKPVGFKFCLGIHREFLAVVKAMLKTGILPDFITVDGAEGGTGAAPIEYTNHVGTILDDGIVYVHSALVGAGLRDKIKIIASGKIVNGFDMACKIALGADLCNMARPMLFALGCIQAVRCHTNTCPTGIATQDPKRIGALDVEIKHSRVANFHDRTVKSFLSMVGAMNLSSPSQLAPNLFWRRVADEVKVPFDQIYTYLAPDQLLGDVAAIPEHYRQDWVDAVPEQF